MLSFEKLIKGNNGKLIIGDNKEYCPIHFSR